MKINTDIGDVSARRALNSPRTPVRSSAASAAVGPDSAGNGRDYNQAILSRLSVERALGEALSVAQASMSIVQRAIVVSSQLKNAAADAVRTGRLDSAAVAEASSQLPENLPELRTSIVIPALSPAAASVSFDIPSPEAAIVSLRFGASGLAAGERPNPEFFADLESSLGDTYSAYEAAAGEAAAVMTSAVETYNVDVENPYEAASAVGAAIGGSPANALATQGNIQRDAVSALLG